MFYFAKDLFFLTLDIMLNLNHSVLHSLYEEIQIILSYCTHCIGHIPDLDVFYLAKPTKEQNTVY